MHKLLLLIVPLLASCSTTSPFFNFQGTDTIAVQSEVRAIKISDANSTFVVYRINDSSIGIVNPSLKDPVNQLVEIENATILTKDQVSTLCQTISLILASYDDKEKTGNRTIDFILMNKQTSSRMQTVGFSYYGESRGESEVTNNHDVLFRLQYSFSKSFLRVPDQTVCYSRGLGSNGQVPVVSYSDLKDLLETLTR